MGLDMWFEARDYLYKSYARCTAEEGKVDETNYPDNLKVMADYILGQNFKSTVIETNYQIGYFRKFNALHNFIVNNYADGEDNCQPICLTETNIKEMLEICQTIRDDHSKAAELMPTTEGFFFGSTEYDDWYYSNIEAAIELFNLILDNKVCENYRIIYQASW